MSSVTIVCVICGKEKTYDSFEYAESKGWTLGNHEYCKTCKVRPPAPPSKPKVWYQFYWYLSLLRGNMRDNLQLDRIRRSDELFMAYWDSMSRQETWVEDTLAHWHIYPADFSWKRYRNDRATWLKYNASLEQRALNYHYMVYTFHEHRAILDYWCGPTLEIY